MNDLKWRPRISYGAGPTVFAFSLAMRPWEPSSRMIGGGDDVNGVPLRYEITRYRGALLRLRVRESEWPSVRAWLEAAQGEGLETDFRFDQTDAGTEFGVYVTRPGPDDPIQPTRGETRGTYEIEVEVRSSNGSAIDLAAF